KTQSLQGRPASARGTATDYRSLTLFQIYMSEVFAATGRRKTAVAQVRVSRGSGKIEVNGRPLEEYFATPSLQSTVLKPFEVTKTSNSFDVKVKTTGGGIA